MDTKDLKQRIIESELKPLLVDGRWEGAYEFDIEDIQEKRSNYAKTHKQYPNKIIITLPEGHTIYGMDIIKK